MSTTHESAGDPGQHQGLRRAFFFGAGASCADGFPLTRDIVYGVSDVITRLPLEYERLLRFLRNVFQISDEDLSRGAGRWQEFVQRSPAPTPSSRILLPDIVELLSLLDVLINDDSLVAGETRQNGEAIRTFSARELSRVRESISRAIASAFSELAWQRSSSGVGTTREFVRSLTASDTLITTNWDLLLDKALDSQFGTDPTAVGSDVLIVDRPGTVIQAQVRAPRPPLYKLHGSLNWLTCQRCTRLYVNPTVYIAELGLQRARHGGDWESCDCEMPLSALLITPTYFKQYRNRHLSNIWAHAQERLASSDVWYFVGYSLPTDDVHIRALLLRALHMRLDARRPMPRIIIVTNRQDEELEARYARLFREVEIDARGFSPSTGTVDSPGLRFQASGSSES